VNLEFKRNFPSGQRAARAFSRGGRRFATLLPPLDCPGLIVQTGRPASRVHAAVAAFGFASLRQTACRRNAFAVRWAERPCATLVSACRSFWKCFHFKKWFLAQYPAA